MLLPILGGARPGGRGTPQGDPLKDLASNGFVETLNDLERRPEDPLLCPLGYPLGYPLGDFLGYPLGCLLGCPLGGLLGGLLGFPRGVSGGSS